MPISIGSNISALKLVRQFARSTSEISTTFERLSSGLRINSAADDAAGLSVSESLKVDAKIARRARANVNDGVSALQIANGAIDQISGLLTRMAELAEQSANGTFADEQRKALDGEYRALDKEIHRIAASTEFNGLKLFDGERARNQYEQITNNAAGNVGAMAISADGQVLTYFDGASGTLQQLNRNTGLTSTITSQIQAGGIVKASASGNTVIFSSSSDITGQNASGRVQLFSYDVLSGNFAQLTNSQMAGETFDITAGVQISADGSTVTFSSLTNYIDGNTAQAASGLRANGGLFALDLGTGVIRTLIPDVAQISGAVSLSADGGRIAFLSNGNFLGTNADGNYELYSAELAASSFNLTQITNTSGILSSTTNGAAPYASFGILNNGTVIFSSEANITGANSALESQIFRYDSSTGSTSQLTNYTVATGVSIFDFQLNVEGDRVFFFSNIDMLGDGSNSQSVIQAFEYDLMKEETIQNTAYTDSTILGVVRQRSGDGNTLVQLSGSDLTGQNADGSTEIFALDIGMDAFGLDIEVGSGFAGSIITNISSITAGLKGLGGLTISSREGAYGALEAARKNIERLGALQGILGAGLSRLDTASNVLMAGELQYQAAASRIVDADIATESANLVRTQILQQATAAVLAQASNQPRIAAELLQV